MKKVKITCAVYYGGNSWVKNFEAEVDQQMIYKSQSSNTKQEVGDWIRQTYYSDSEKVVLHTMTQI